jgi:hypothetical protein
MKTRSAPGSELSVRGERLPRSPLSAPGAVAIFGSAVRRGEWEPPDFLPALALFGTVTLDFRGAILEPGVTEVAATAVFGTVEVIVPPDLEVEVDSGVSLFGTIQETHASARVGARLRRFLLGPGEPLPDDDDAPILYVRARVLFGAVHVRRKD